MAVTKSRPVARRETAGADDDEEFRRFVRTVEKIKARNAHWDEQEIYDLIDRELEAYRAGRP